MTSANTKSSMLCDTKPKKREERLRGCLVSHTSSGPRAGTCFETPLSNCFNKTHTFPLKKSSISSKHTKLRSIWKVRNDYTDPSVSLTDCCTSVSCTDKPEGVENNEKLIWATDFNGVLLEMQKERHQRVEGRQKEVPEEEDPNSLEAQLFGAPSQPSVRGRNDSQATAVPSMNFNNNGEIVASRQSSMTSLNLNAYSGSPLQDSNLRTLDVRSRATTMEQLGLEPPLYESLTRCISHDPAHVQDRERSTTLDLFAYEQQGYAASCPQSLVSSPKAGASRSYLNNAERRLNEHSSNDST